MTVSLMERLQLLFDYVYPAGGKPYSASRVAELASTPATEVSLYQVKSILSGETQDPSYRTIAALATFFNVPVDYFSTTDQKTWDSYVNWIKKMRDRVDNTEVYAARTNRWHEIRKERRERKKREDSR